MARQTRAQRRARRAEQERQGNGAEARPVQQRQMQPAKAEPAVESDRRLPGSGFRRFVSESIAELKKVDWPNRAQTIQGTVVVIIAVLIVGAYLWGIDQLIRPLVRHVLLGQ